MTTIECYPIASREEWLAQRRQDLTASDIPAICGIHPSRSPLQVYAQKKGLIHSVENNLMRRGRWFQPAILMALRERHPELNIWEPNCYYRDPETRIGATPDFFSCPLSSHDFGDTAPTAVIEGKVVSAPIFRESWVQWDDEEDIAEEDIGTIPSAMPPVQAPIYYEMQAVIQAKLCLTPQASVAGLVHDTWSSELVECPINLEYAFDAGGLWDFIVERTDKFHWCLKTDTPPTDFLLPKIDAKLLGKIYPRDDGPVLDFSDDKRIGGLIFRYQLLTKNCSAGKAALKPVEAERNEVKSELLAAMGMSGRATYQGGEITLKAISVKPSQGYSYRKLHIRSPK